MASSNFETIYIYNENCVMKGCVVPNRELERYENPEEGNDWSGYEASQEMVDILLASKSAFDRKCGRTLAEYVR